MWGIADLSMIYHVLHNSKLNILSTTFVNNSLKATRPRLIIGANNFAMIE